MAYTRPLTFFPDPNEIPEEVRNTATSDPHRKSPAPTFNPVVPLDQLLTAQFDMDANSHTLYLCVDAMTLVSNVSRRLQSRTNEVQADHSTCHFSAYVSRCLKENSQLKKKNTELKRRTTITANYLAPWYSSFDS
ncbi:unnamed protein product [Camellia sinensis]